MQCWLTWNGGCTVEVGRCHTTTGVDFPSGPRSYAACLSRYHAYRAAFFRFATAFIAADGAEEGIQVFDLTQLRHLAQVPMTFNETAHYDRFGGAHTISGGERKRNGSLRSYR